MKIPPPFELTTSPQRYNLEDSYRKDLRFKGICIASEVTDDFALSIFKAEDEDGNIKDDNLVYLFTEFTDSGDVNYPGSSLSTQLFDSIRDLTKRLYFTGHNATPTSDLIGRKVIALTKKMIKDMGILMESQIYCKFEHENTYIKSNDHTLSTSDI